MSLTYEAIDRQRAYKFESNPLEVVLDPEIGTLIYTSVGDCFECVRSTAGSFLFEEVYPTVISDGTLLPDLNKTQLDLFWALSRSELKASKYGVKDTSERSR